MAEDTPNMFSAVDFVIFALMLLISSVIGIFFAWRHRKLISTEDYLLANRQMSWFPVCVSMVASFFSAIGVMGIPSQIYTTGITFGLNFFAFIPPIAFCAEVLTPIYRKLNLTSVNEYLERRFSVGVRYLGCLLFLFQYLLYMSIVLYAPSLALQSVAGVPLAATIISTGVVCTFYTTLGGMRAVIWTDVFQSAIMILGLLLTAILGVYQVGGFTKVIDMARKYERFTVDFNFDPRINHTAWGVIFGFMVSVGPSWTIGQPTVQRIISAKSEKHAKGALYASAVVLFPIGVLLIIDAMVIFALYGDCDLQRSGKIQSNDQIIPFFVVNALNHLPGVPGLFTACLFSFALSTLSSGLNAVSALFVEDIIKKRYPEASETVTTRVAKVSAICSGAFLICFAFVVPKLGKFILSLTLKLFGIIGGPYLGLFILGLFSTKTNARGVCSGAISGLALAFFLVIGSIIYPPDKQLPPISIQGCSGFNATTSNSTGIIYPTAPVHTSPIASVFTISYVWVGLISFCATLLVGYISSLIFNCFSKVPTQSIDPDLLYDFNNNCLVRCVMGRKRHNSQKPEEMELMSDKV